MINIVKHIGNKNVKHNSKKYRQQHLTIVKNKLSNMSNKVINIVNVSMSTCQLTPVSTANATMIKNKSPSIELFLLLLLLSVSGVFVAAPAAVVIAAVAVALAPALELAGTWRC
jgi:hypothetical protein